MKPGLILPEIRKTFVFAEAAECVTRARNELDAVCGSNAGRLPDWGPGLSCYVFKRLHDAFQAFRSSPTSSHGMGCSSEDHGKILAITVLF